MRIKEEYKKSGYFWLANNPDMKIPGTLFISNRGNIELEIIGIFDNGNNPFTDNAELTRIIGHIEKDGFVTLESCFYKKRNMTSGGISKSLIHANLVLSGAAFEDEELLKFNTFTFTADGLDEWIGLCGIKVTYEENFTTATIKYKPQEEIIYKLNDEISLHVLFSYTLPGAPITKEARISQTTYLRLSSENEKELSEFIEYAYKFINMLCFAIDTTVTIYDVTVTSNAITREYSKESSSPVKIKVFYPSLPFTDKIPKITFHDMLFSFHQIKEDAAVIMNKWLDAYDVIEPSLNLYFSVKSGDHKYLEGKFLALAQALETYHRRTSNEVLMDNNKFRSLVAKLLCDCPKTDRRWLRGRLFHGNEINLGKRIKMIIEPYKSHIGNSKERSKLIRGIVNTRNYLTHYSENLKSEAMTGTDLWVLCQRMEAIFQLHLLGQLGFTYSEINTILGSNYKLQQKFKEI